MINLQKQSNPIMHNKRCKHKGFTIIEASIVLVIVGVILALIIGFKQMHRSAKIRVLSAKPLKISQAINSYYDMYDRYPGDNKTIARVGFISERNNTDMWLELLNAGLLSKSDIMVTRAEYAGFANNYDLQFTSFTCVAPDKYIIATNRSSIGTITFKPSGCFGLTLAYALSSTSPSNHSVSIVNGYTPISLIAGYEIYYDDLDLISGLGRTDETNSSVYNTMPFKDALFAPGALKDYKGTSVKQNMRISFDRYFFLTQDRH